MGLLSKLRRHAAIATANFAYMFQKVEIPPLPAAVSRLIAEANREEPDFDRLSQLISSTTGLAAKVIQTVNSPLYRLQRPVTSVRHALTMLGIKNIRTLALAYATMTSLPKPDGRLFDEESFWTDSLLHALLARSLCKGRFDADLEDAFTASLLSHVAVPVLMITWHEYYSPVVQEWKHSPRRLSEIERAHFGWDHAQAGAWIVHYWQFPEELVCYIGAHNLDWPTLVQHELDGTIAVPLAVAALAPSTIKDDPSRTESFIDAAQHWLDMEPGELGDRVDEVRSSFQELLKLFGLSCNQTESFFDQVHTLIESRTQ